ncbi:MAG: tyrosine--tRNA ligase [Candidatus Kerfeldbacteria bacterium RIFCSPHIGHO2_12_FULL_48_17]|uniref:Tyrosine--tRNA ligase n=1 Tax=Candidatus Kerfeldbacteria bacterium RIFCSPHIGHO2_12_FULL_48_17 TaxID=1798542 RepID=A0A1G2B1G8_9BACT|nr:MAG: tyrosine--tRNA ligase [Candidatus Kerfeldbacteria bacterium RIFCSPHIGHO2_12_FULL_48_17]
MDINELEGILLSHPDLSNLPTKEQLDIITERSKHIVGNERLKELFQEAQKTKRPIRIKYGIDATGKELHLGHAIPLFVLRRLQKMGHEITLLIGDFTAQIGDPSGRVTSRPILTKEEIQDNAARFKEQAAKIIDIEKTIVRFNTEWLNDFKLSKFLQICGSLTVASAMQREDFRNRETITRAEMLYSTLMAIDSVVLGAEIELGGDDQLLNFHDTKRVMHNEGMQPQVAITTELLLGTTGDGRKMSKSYGNYISLTEDGSSMFGKFMSIKDEQLEQYFKLLTDIRNVQWDELDKAMKSGTIHPMEVKRLLARVVISDLSDREAARIAEEDFQKRVVEKVLPEDIKKLTIAADKATSWLEILDTIKLPQVKSRADIRRLMKEGGVHDITDPETSVIIQLTSVLPRHDIVYTLRVGKRTYVQFIIKKHSEEKPE